MSHSINLDKPGFTRERPGTSAELRNRLYGGEIFLFAPTPATLALSDAAERAIRNAFGDSADPQTAVHEMAPDKFFSTAGELRRQFYKEPEFHDLVADVIAELAFEPQRTTFDPARLRVVLPFGHENPAAAPVYYGHRDTWYANPQSMLTWWIPLQDVDASNSFAFFTECFSQAVANDSEIFNFDDWVTGDEKKLIGWQDKKTGLTAPYPRLLEKPRGPETVVAGPRGSLLLFSGQHLHRTFRQTTNRARFSLDFRTVDLEDADCGREAPNVDNRSTGSWATKFLNLADVLGGRE